MSTNEYTTRLQTRWKKYEGFGESHGLREWARLIGISHGSLRRYLQKGLTVEDVVQIRGLKYPT